MEHSHPHRQIKSLLNTLSGEHLQGKDEPLRLAVIAMLTGGHLLLEDLPGLGKTTLALALAAATGLSFGRIQCTSDLLPSDITGLSVYEKESGRFRFVPGPVFSNIVLLDEINRAMPRTQSAMLEAMEERRVTVEGVTYQLPDPFMVIATQNPVEHVGTFPLPESQLDRFLACTGIGYPPETLEKIIITGGGIREKIGAIREMVTADDILSSRKAIVDEVVISQSVVDYIYRIITVTRSSFQLLAGLSTRAAINMAMASKAAAFIEGRDFVVPEDVRSVSVAVCAHRVMLRSGESIDRRDLIRKIVEEIPAPLV